MSNQTPAAISPTGQTWNTEAYATNGRFVADLASGVVDLLAGATRRNHSRPRLRRRSPHRKTRRYRSRRHWSRQLRHHGRRSAPAQSQHRPPQRRRSSLRKPVRRRLLQRRSPWLPAAKQPLVLAGVYRALKPGGRFVAEMGGQGNIAAIRIALQTTLAPFHIDAEGAAESFYPSPAVYRRLLEAAGFKVQSIDLNSAPYAAPQRYGFLAQHLPQWGSGSVGPCRSRHRPY